MANRTTLEAIERNGFEYKTIKYKPFDMVEACQELFPGEDCVIFYGSLGLAKQLRSKAQWIPGIYYNIPVFNCHYYYGYLGNHLFNGNYIMLPYGDLLRRKEFLFEHLSSDRAIFLRPSRGDKIFTGKVVYKENYERDIEIFDFNQISPEEIIIAAEPRNIDKEWRFVVVEGKVITGSQYKENERSATEASYPQEAFDFAVKVAGEYNPDPVWVIDVCLTKSGEYGLMEVGCFSCAGLYKYNRDIIVKEVSAAALREWESYQ